LRQDKCFLHDSKFEGNKHLTFQIETLYDQQVEILEEKLRSQRHLLQKLGNGVGNDENSAANADNVEESKRKIEFEKFIISKKFRINDGDEDDN
jgi:hypothetical protein